jgi:translation initiation factor eIF-2B subunit delta
MIDETAEEIAAMQTHSSSDVAVKAARALRALLDREYPTVDEYHRALERNSAALRRANRSHASLHTTQHAIVAHVEESDPASVDAAKAATREAILAAIERVEESKRRAAVEAQRFLSDGMTLLTHDYSTTVLAALERATEAGDSFTVYVTEARPRYLGRKMARQLADFDAVEAHLIVDGACGHYLPDCDRVVTGIDCVVEDTLYNRVGTYPLTATAADVGVPVTAIGAASKLVEGGFSFENEHRVASEAMREPADGFQIDNPAYDATPTRLLDSIVTDEGVIEPPR